MAQKEVRVAREPLKEFTKEVFVRVGVPPEDAETEAEVLVWANLRGGGFPRRAADSILRARSRRGLYEPKAQYPSSEGDAGHPSN